MPSTSHASIQECFIGSNYSSRVQGRPNGRKAMGHDDDDGDYK